MQRLTSFSGQSMSTGMAEGKAQTSNTSLPAQAGGSISLLPMGHTVPSPKHLQLSFQLTEEDWKCRGHSDVTKGRLILYIHGTW